MRHPFLSEAWISEVERIRDQYRAQVPPLDVEAKVNVVVTDIPFGEKIQPAHLTTEGGVLSIDRGHLEAPDAIVTCDYATARNLVVDQDQAQLMEAFMSGQLTVQGDLNRLMELAAAASPLDQTGVETANRFGQAIREVTA